MGKKYERLLRKENEQLWEDLKIARRALSLACGDDDELWGKAIDDIYGKRDKKKDVLTPDAAQE